MKRLTPHLTGRHGLEKGTSYLKLLVSRSVAPTESLSTMSGIHEMQKETAELPRKNNSTSSLLQEEDFSNASTDSSYHPNDAEDQQSFDPSDSLFLVPRASQAFTQTRV